MYKVLKDGFICSGVYHGLLSEATQKQLKALFEMGVKDIIKEEKKKKEQPKEESE